MKLFQYLWVSTILLSCTAQKEKPSFEKVWFYDDNLTGEKQLENLNRYEGSNEYGFSSASFVNLEPGGKFTSYFSAFDYGTWKLQDSTLLLINHGNGRLALEVKRLEPTYMICMNKSNHKVYRFNGFPNHFASSAQSPFSAVNNQWRQKAGHKETDAQLAARLKNHFRWWESYFSWGLNNKFNQMDIQSTPSVLEMYSNGFELRYYDYQFPEWRNIFYDTADCWRAYEMVYYLMYKKDINWPKTKNRFERFVSAFQQLQQWMDSDPQSYLPPRDSARANKKERKETGT